MVRLGSDAIFQPENDGLLQISGILDGDFAWSGFGLGEKRAGFCWSGFDEKPSIGSLGEGVDVGFCPGLRLKLGEVCVELMISLSDLWMETVTDWSDGLVFSLGFVPDSGLGESGSWVV